MNVTSFDKQETKLGVVAVYKIWHSTSHSRPVVSLVIQAIYIVYIHNEIRFKLYTFTQ